MKVQSQHIRQRLRRHVNYIAAPLSVVFIFFLSLYFLSFHDVSLAVDGRQFNTVTRAATVGELLKSQGIAYSAHDRVMPATSKALTGIRRVEVRHAYPVALTLDYETAIIWTLSDTVRGVLEEQGISAKTAMRVSERLATKVSPGMRIRVAFLRHQLETVEEEIAYPTRKIDDPQLPQGRTKVRTAGRKGVRRRVIDHVLAAGKEISSTVIKDEIAVAPQEEVIATGTKLPQLARRTPVVPLTSRGGRAIMMVATGYAAGTGGAGSRTATGTGVYRGIVAVDPGVIPLGTRLYIDGYGEAVAADTGGAIRGNRIDLGFGSAAEAMQWGRRSVTVHFL